MATHAADSRASAHGAKGKKKSPHGKQSKWLFRGIVLIGGLTLVGSILGVVIAYSGLVQGSEFSPETFRRRHFRYRRLPLVGVQITPIRRSDATLEFEKQLLANQMLGPAVDASTPPTWHLIFLERGTRRMYGDASILTVYLDMYSDGEHVWRRWTREHPEQAKVFWPAVAELARNELYIWIPDLMNLPKGIDSADELHRKIDEYLTDRYRQFGEEMSANGEPSLAVELFDLGLRHAPNDVSLVDSRRREYEKLSTEERAAADARVEASKATSTNNGSSDGDAPEPNDASASSRSGDLRSRQEVNRQEVTTSNTDAGPASPHPRLAIPLTHAA